MNCAGHVVAQRLDAVVARVGRVVGVDLGGHHRTGQRARESPVVDFCCRLSECVIGAQDDGVQALVHRVDARDGAGYTALFSALLRERGAPEFAQALLE